ncbi:hypothetical protein [Micromonospora chokoriensis]|uniref:hypothetical protein n=1 Tax=Micromonospora chokoriensis TaxID=356851 RepID=UPI0004C3610C|nr:hypothetical protein [Micromonospora chokoriensis]
MIAGRHAGRQAGLGDVSDRRAEHDESGLADEHDLPDAGRLPRPDREQGEKSGEDAEATPLFPWPADLRNSIIDRLALLR